MVSVLNLTQILPKNQRIIQSHGSVRPSLQCLINHQRNLLLIGLVSKLSPLHHLSPCPLLQQVQLLTPLYHLSQPPQPLIHLPNRPSYPQPRSHVGQEPIPSIPYSPPRRQQRLPYHYHLLLHAHLLSGQRENPSLKFFKIPKGASTTPHLNNCVTL